MSTSVMTGVARIERAFARARAERRLAIVAYLVVGHPEKGATAALVRAALDGGADIIELGVPFSDPLADGTTVQRASEVALREGVRLADCIRVGAEVVSQCDAAVLLMGYTNPFLQHGYERLAGDLATAGLAGVIVPDMPAEESAELDAAFAAGGLARIDLYAPTTPDDRLARLVPRARGFVYCVSLTGVTGARSAIGADALSLVARVRRHTSLPVALGFGIATAAHVAALRGVADGAVVGSALLDRIDASPPAERAGALRSLVRELHEAGRS